MTGFIYQQPAGFFCSRTRIVLIVFHHLPAQQFCSSRSFFRLLFVIIVCVLNITVAYRIYSSQIGGSFILPAVFCSLRACCTNITVLVRLLTCQCSIRHCLLKVMCRLVKKGHIAPLLSQQFTLAEHGIFNSSLHRDNSFYRIGLPCSQGAFISIVHI